MNYIGEKEIFKFHPGCYNLKFNHLYLQMICIFLVMVM